MEGVTIIKAATLPDHVHMYVSIPPKESVAKVAGRIKGKSNVNEATIKKYIDEQYESDRLEGEF